MSTSSDVGLRHGEKVGSSPRLKAEFSFASRIGLGAMTKSS